MKSIFALAPLAATLVLPAAVRAQPAPDIFPAALTIADGVYQPAPGQAPGQIAGQRASGVHISSPRNQFFGAYIKGARTDFTLSHSRIDLYGNGTDDISGPTGIVLDDGARLTLRHVTINTYGLVASALQSGGGSVLRVYDSTLHTTGGTIPKDYKRKTGPGPFGLLMPPWPLGIYGSSRVQITTGNSRAYYYHSTISSNYWGALSTDAADGDVYVEANDCVISVAKSGYGAYADVGADVVINDSRVEAPTYGAIIAGSGAMTLNGSDLRSGGIGVMMHAVGGPDTDPLITGTLKLRGGELHAATEAVLVKSGNANIVFDRVQLSSDTGMLLRSIVNPDGMAVQAGNAPVRGVNAVMIGMAVTGAIAHEDPKRPMNLSLIGTSLTGPVRDVTLTLDKKSHWTATQNSRVILQGAMDAGQIDAPAGVVITASNGKGSTLKGQYQLKSGGVLAIGG